MRDFKSYKPENNSSQNYMNIISSLAKKYEGASESDLISAIMLEAEKGRKNGTLTNNDIDNFVKVLSPMLNASQQKKLYEVVKKIKSSK
jgi:hypothetical protein